MTFTVKLEPNLEEQLRQRAQASGRSASDVVRAALQAYLKQEDADPPQSAFACGATLFGRHQGPANLAQQRKQEWANLLAVQHQRRG